MKTKPTFALLTLVLLAGMSRAAAQDTMFTYQGRVLDNGTNFNGTGQFKFALVTGTNDPSFVTYWSNDGTSVNGSEPSAAVSVGVTDGLFTVVLGDTTVGNMTAIDASVFAQPGLQLRIWFDDGVNGSSALSPVQALTPTPYAIQALNLAGVVQNNVIGTNEFATVGGGVNNTGTGYSSTIAGGYSNTSSNYYTTVAGGLLNIAGAYAATVGGGGANVASGTYATVGGGSGNHSTGDYTTISGGSKNYATAFGATVGGGGYNGSFVGNFASGVASTISGGFGNTNNGNYATICGGAYNFANNVGYATMTGGSHNTCSGYFATVCGGNANVAAGDYTFAAGINAQALHTGAFVWADDSGGSFASTANNQFAVRAAGGVRFAGDVQLDGGAAYHHLQLSGGNALGYLYGSYPALADGIHLGYNYYYDAGGTGHISNSGGGTSRISADYGEIVLAVGGVNSAPTTVRLDATTSGVTVYGTFNNMSDRNAKQDFAPVDPAQILKKVAQLPISEWSYKEDAATRHIGPVAQDFHAAFNVGTDDKHIAPIDEGGVVLAAIQALNQRLKDKDAQIQRLDKELRRMEAVVNGLAAQK